MVKKSKNLSPDVRKLIIEASDRGDKQTVIATTYHCDRSTVSKIVKKYKNRNSTKDKPRSGRPRITSARVDRTIKLKSTADVKKSAIEISREIETELGVKVSRFTVGRRLDVQGLHSHIAVRKPWVSAKNRKARLEFAKKYQNWTTQDWKKVMWTDESKFNLFGSDGRRYVRRPDGHRYDPHYMTGTMKHGGGSVMVYGAFTSTKIGPLVKIEGNMDKVIYRNILEKTTVPFAKKKLKRGWILQADNDPKHSSNYVKDWLKANRIRVLEWPSQSPDCNPIEPLWNELAKRVGTRSHKNRDELFDDLKQEWENLPPKLLADLVASMPRRLDAVIKANGYPTKY